MSLSDLVASGVRFGVTFSSFAISTVVPIVNVLAAFYSFWSLFKMEKSHVYKRNVQWKFNRGVLLSVLIFSFTGWYHPVRMQVASKHKQNGDC